MNPLATPARRAAMFFALGAVLFGSAIGLSGCNKSPSLLLRVTADAPVQQYDLYLRDDATQQIVFHSGFNPVLAPGETSKDTGGGRDLTKETLKVAVKLSSGGKFTLLLVGVIGDIQDGKPAPTATQLFWGGRFEVHGATSVDAKLLTVPAGDDADGDLWPDATDFRAHVPEAATLYASSADLLDCDDKMNNPVDADGKVINIMAASINPFAIELCGDGYDEDCNGNADEPCVDQDKDGDPRGDDCDDKDPARHKPTLADPFPDPPNCCGYSLGKGLPGTPEGTVSYLGQPICPAPRCGDGIDESCRGQGENNPANDTACVIDADCDGTPADKDCDDNDPTVHPGAVEICGNNKNDSCASVNGMPIVDYGCVACDLDGDGYERLDPGANCPDSKDVHPGMIDCNDYDSGVHPGETVAAGNVEGGINSMGRPAAAAKGFCRRVYETTGVTGTAKISISGFTAGDADCNGMAYQDCPDPTCDVDGDGYPKDASCGQTGPFDCNDNDPTIYPQAPDKCGDGVDSSCLGADTSCNGMDADGDGYIGGFQGAPDCDDTNPNIHPFATEVCNGVDDDCDGDKDEGNPDPNGAALILGSGVATCKDSTIGQCNLGMGLCVCSSADAKSTINVTNRVACSGDPGTGAMGIGSHCYGAPQPHPQTCNAVDQDDDCNGTSSDLTGANLLVEGTACGLTMGPCKQGKVTGCDRNQTTSPYFGAQATPDDVHWICAGGINPSAEVCNGIDDDCNGSITDAPLDERDEDMDKYITCGPCVGTIATGLLGCGDCNDANPNVNPGAMEKCNGIDDDCNPATTDGQTECGNAGKTCCFANGGGNTCRNLATDAQYCGSCTNTCNSVFVNACGGGSCVCGTTNAACNPGNYCSGNGCSSCNTTAHCGSTCNACGTNQVCKTDGSGCTGCNVDNDCGSGNYCKTDGNCAPKIPPGGACTTADASQTEHSCSGTQYCTDGVCCDKSQQACGVCQTCKAGAPGICTNVALGQDPNNECTANLMSCISDSCNGNGSCAATDNTYCGMPTCDTSGQMAITDVKECTNGTCNATPTPLTMCGDYACMNGACLTSCTMDSQCISTKPHCNLGDGKCYSANVPGSACSQGSDCSSGACVSGKCCGITSRPTSCGSSDTSCSGSTLTTYTCSGPSYTSCTTASAGCPTNLSCASTTSCNTQCDCTTDPCTSTECKSGYYCPSDNSNTCNACNTVQFCGSSCTPCTPTCTNGKQSGQSCTSGACSGQTSCGTGYTCNAGGTACNTACAVDTDCATGYFCKSGGTCTADIKSTKACDDANCMVAGCQQCLNAGMSATASCPTMNGMGMTKDQCP